MNQQQRSCPQLSKKKENEENYESRVFYSLKSGRFNNDLLVFYPNIMTQEISDIS